MPTHASGPTDHPTGAGDTTGATVTDDALLDALRDWLPERRWFPAKGGGAELSVAGGFALTDPRGQAQVRVLLVRARSATVDAVLQVPLTLHADRSAAPEGSDWITTVADGRVHVHVRDGAGDPAFLRAWLAAADGGDTAPADLGLDTDRPRVISGEQSNTSVILPGPDGGAILKVFRALTPGENPDVDVPRRLAAQGWTNVPRPLGWLDGTWTTADGEAHGSLGVLSQFVEGASDGFELACGMAARDESFGRLAEDLGRVVAGMHVALASALPVDDGGSGADELVAALEERFRWAVGSVPELERWSDAIGARLAGVREREGLLPASASTVTCTSGRPCALATSGSSWTSRVSRSAGWRPGPVPTSRCVTSPGC
ncbi:maltokinase N-terminal cap-like domain-containing protein [Cellulomonas sp. ATA003]|uniref:maltokinase N-terminal cap-like domain-containing protein n=1 Tax=Cellulomonas sp. ATA003 TaxID=3073064 RepID=UPI0028732A5B|nr:aminoglycoside phosphotransferase [Cellulomonas sp. ATA003]WNB84799.1 aminoglycoside phosphotransferase [Cellulomonas sp. ATA003]